MTIFIPKRNSTDAVCRRLAKSICVKLRLPQDDALSHVIGNGTESTIEGAVSTWLHENGVDPSQYSLQDACDALERELLARLDV